MQQPIKPPRLWPLFGCVIVVLGLFLFQDELPISQTLHEQAEVGIVLFSFGLLHIVGGELIARLRAYHQAQQNIMAQSPQPGSHAADGSSGWPGFLRALGLRPFQDKRI